MTTQATDRRPTLGDFMSVTCFHFLRVGAEDIAGRVPIVAAGRERGANVVETLGLLNSSVDPSFLRDQLGAALGVDGTRLCIVDEISTKPNGGYEVRISEGACTAGVVSSEPHCAYTMGVFVGAIGAMTGKKMRGTETICSAMGSPQCIYQIDPL